MFIDEVNLAATFMRRSSLVITSVAYFTYVGQPITICWSYAPTSKVSLSVSNSVSFERSAYEAELIPSLCLNPRLILI